MAEYRVAMKNYKENLTAWESLTEKEKLDANLKAESDETRFFAIVGGAALGGVAWYLSYKKWAIDGLLGLAMIACGAIIFTASSYSQVISGRFFRAVAFSPLIYLFLAIVVWALSLISGLIESISSMIYPILFPASLVISFIIELSGSYHASAEPREPTMPSP